MKRIYFTVTNDLSYDQRMHRICNSLAGAGYAITLIGRKQKHSLPLHPKSFTQKRLNCFFNKGFLFYAEYNFRLFFFLLFKKMDGICAIDLDTILPCLFISKLKKIIRVYDAHEYFTELKEVRSRPLIKKIWSAIERFAVPKYQNGYTVSQGLADAFKNNYQKEYPLIRNLPLLKKEAPFPEREKVLLYQGAVNEARGFEYLIPAMKFIPYQLIVCGDGNFMPQLKQLIAENNVTDKVHLTGMLLPDDLRAMTPKATLGISVSEKDGINQFFALPNKFFDYMHACLPQITMNFPEYQKINDEYKVAVLLDTLSIEEISQNINRVMEDENLLQELRANCMKARDIYCWQNEEKRLLEFYQSIFKE